MSTCKTCRFWEPTDAFDLNPHAGFCGHSLVGCKDVLPPNGLADGTLYGRIVTGPEFGCVHHECVCAGPMDLSEIKVEITGDGIPHGECEYREQQ